MFFLHPLNRLIKLLHWQWGCRLLTTSKGAVDWLVGIKLFLSRRSVAAVIWGDTGKGGPYTPVSPDNIGTFIISSHQLMRCRCRVDRSAKRERGLQQIFTAQMGLSRHPMSIDKGSSYAWEIINILQGIYYYVFHGRVTLFFANNFLIITHCRITMKFLHNFF